MSLLRCRRVWVAVAMLALEMSLSGAGEACSLVSKGPTSWSPQSNGSLGVDAPLLLWAVQDPENASVVSDSGERVELMPEPSFRHVTGGSSFGFFWPQSALEPDTAYTLESSNGLSVPFTTRAVAPRISAVLSLKTELLPTEPFVLSSAMCYGGVFEGRKLAHDVTIAATIEPWAPLIILATSHDAESNSDVEQSVASHMVASPTTLTLELLLPDGFDDCPHVTVLDYAGTTLLDVPRLCVTEEGSALTESVEAFDQPKESPKSEADPSSASGGCALGGAADGGLGTWALVLALGALNRRLRPRGFVKPPTI